MKTPIDKFWGTFGHLDLEPGEALDKDDVLSTGNFSDAEIDVLIASGLVSDDSQKSSAPYSSVGIC